MKILSKLKDNNFLVECDLKETSIITGIDRYNLNSNTERYIGDFFESKKIKEWENQISQFVNFNYNRNEAIKSLETALELLKNVTKV